MLYGLILLFRYKTIAFVEINIDKLLIACFCIVSANEWLFHMPHHYPFKIYAFDSQANVMPGSHWAFFSVADALKLTSIRRCS